jgi:hypothetical protein
VLTPEAEQLSADLLRAAAVARAYRDAVCDKQRKRSRARKVFKGGAK